MFQRQEQFPVALFKNCDILNPSSLGIGGDNCYVSTEFDQLNFLGYSFHIIKANNGSEVMIPAFHSVDPWPDWDLLFTKFQPNIKPTLS